jgi:hypothetical protein
MADLFDAEDLRTFMQVPAVDAGTVARVRRFATGWLLNATRLTSFPDPAPDDLWAWAVELAAIAYRNPSAFTNASIDDFSVGFDGARRKEILDAARAAYSGASLPSYEFPEWDWHWVATPVTSTLTQ